MQEKYTDQWCHRYYKRPSRDRKTNKDANTEAVVRLRVPAVISRQAKKRQGVKSPETGDR